MTRKLLTCLVLLVAVLMAGCGEGIIFEEKGSVSEDLRVATESTMVRDVYYVKDGTQFFPLTVSATEQRGTSPDPKNDFLMYPDGLDSAPTLYKGETLCIKQGTSQGLSELPVVRYKDVGYTLGIYGLEYDEDMEYYSTSADSVAQGSQAASLIGSMVYGATFSVKNVDGKEPNVSKPGTLLGMEKGGEYTVDLYAGTDYAPVSMTADMHLYESSEGFVLTSGALTKHGYYAYEMPNGCRSGYYRVGDSMFRYIEDPKAQAKKTYDMNAANTFAGVTYELDDTLPEETTERPFMVEENTLIKLEFNYSEQQAILSEASITSPSGKETMLDTEARGLQEYTAAEAGTYILRLKGYNVNTVVPDIQKSRIQLTPTPTPTPKPTPVPTQVPEPTEAVESGEARLEAYTTDESTYTYIDENGNEVEVNIVTQVEEEYEN